jgi:hypothetical protein
VHIEPTLHEGFGLDAIARLDAAVASRNHLPRPARHPEQIPQPPAPPANPSGGTRRHGWRWWGSHAHPTSHRRED